MIIPPVGQEPISINHGGEPAGGKAPAKSEPHRIDSAGAPKPEGADLVEISNGTRLVQELQSAITRLQMLEQSAAAVEEEAQRIVAHLETENAQNLPDYGSVAVLKRHIEQSVKIVGAYRDAVSRIGQLHGPEAKGAAETRGPELESAVRSVSESVKDLTEAAQRGTRAGAQKAVAEVLARTERLRTAARGEKARVELQIRESIGTAVRESAEPSVRDVAEAERLIAETRRTGQDSSTQFQRMDKVAEKVINLLR